MSVCLNCPISRDMGQSVSNSVFKMARSDKKREAIALLSKNVPQIRVAELIGVDRRTISRWLKLPDFRKELFDNRRDHLESVLDQVVDSSSVFTRNEEIPTSRMDSLIGKSIAALDTILSCPESRTSDRIRAAELIFKLVGSDRFQSFAGNSGGNSSGTPAKTMEGADRTVAIERLLERREQLKNRIAVLKNQQG